MSLQVLEDLKSLGVEVIPQGANLVIRPASKVPAELKERLRAHKAEILAALSERPATRIAPFTIQQAECRHCDGLGECSCTACTLRRTVKAVPCLICHPIERQEWLAATRPEGCWHCRGSGKCSCISCGESCRVCSGTGKPQRVN